MEFISLGAGLFGPWAVLAAYWLSTQTHFYDWKTIALSSAWIDSKYLKGSRKVKIMPFIKILDNLF